MLLAGIAIGLALPFVPPWQQAGHIDGPAAEPVESTSGRNTEEFIPVRPAGGDEGQRKPGAPRPGERNYLGDPDLPPDIPWTIQRANASTVAIAGTRIRDFAGTDKRASGVIVNRKGLIATNRHVVIGAARDSGGQGKYNVRLSDGTVLSATLVSVAAWTPEMPAMSDLALIQLDEPPADLVPATLAETGDLPPGTEVWSVGNPGRRFAPDNHGLEQLRRGEVTTMPPMPGAGGPGRRYMRPGQQAGQHPGTTPGHAGARPSVQDQARNHGSPDQQHGATPPAPGQTDEQPRPREDGLIPGVLVIGNGVNPATGEPASMAKSGNSGGGVFDPRTGELLGLNTMTSQTMEIPGALDTDVGMVLPVESLAAYLEGKVATDTLENVTRQFDEFMGGMQQGPGGGHRGH
jgi:S1-C subfamily serine protease